MASASEALPLDRDEDTLMGKYLVFSMGTEQFGIEIRHITEIIGIQPITSVPEMPPYIKGITNLRGKIIPVMDARIRFGQAYREYDDRTCIIVIDSNQVTTGLIVDRVVEVVILGDEDIVPSTDISNSGSKLIKGYGKAGSKVLLLLDCQKLLADETLIISI